MAKGWSLLWGILACVAIVGVAIGFLTSGGSNEDTNTYTGFDGVVIGQKQKRCEEYRNRYWDNDECKICPEPKRYFAVFWESHVEGCKAFMENPEAFDHVTHIYWGFALINNKTGEVDTKFQGNDNTLKACITSIHRKCVKQLASIGGADNRHQFLGVNTPQKIENFGKTAAKLVHKYNFDGVDFDDESGNGLLSDGDWLKHSSNVVNYIKAVRTELDKLPMKENEPRFTLTWDEFPKAVHKDCSKDSEWLRCYNPEISKEIDWINLMIYNDATTSAYDKILDDLIPNEWVKYIDPRKIVLGGCVGKVGDPGACSYGASPTLKQLSKYGKLGSELYGGIMLWTASTDHTLFNGKNTKTMGEAGEYGIF